MSTSDWHAHWRQWLRAKFGDRLDAATLEAAVAECEALRAVWEPMLNPPLDNGVLPFPNALPSDTPPDGDAP